MDNVKVTLEGDELVAVLPDGSTLAHADAVRLVDALVIRQLDIGMSGQGVGADLAKVRAQTMFTFAAYNLTRMATIFGWRLSAMVA